MHAPRGPRARHTRSVCETRIAHLRSGARNLRLTEIAARACVRGFQIRRGGGGEESEILKSKMTSNETNGFITTRGSVNSGFRHKQTTTGRANETTTSSRMTSTATVVSPSYPVPKIVLSHFAAVSRNGEIAHIMRITAMTR